MRDSSVSPLCLRRVERRSALRTGTRPSWRLLFSITAIVLLIACAICQPCSRARQARERELAVRGCHRRIPRRSCVPARRKARCSPLPAQAIAVVLAQFLGRFLLAAILGRVSEVDASTSHRLAHWYLRAAAAFVKPHFFGTAPAIRAARVAPLAAMRSGEEHDDRARRRLSVQRRWLARRWRWRFLLLVARSFS